MADADGGASPIAALIFDMDGLLVDSEALAAGAVRDFLRQHGHEVRPDVLGRLLGKRLPDAVALLAESYQLDGHLDDLLRTYETLRLAALRGNLRPMPGAAALLTFGRAAGLRLGLATSSLRTHADLALAETGLAGLFDAEATGDEVQRGKPAPDIFLLAADRLGAAPAACVVLEDAPAGIAAARAAGMRPVWVPHAGSGTLPPTLTAEATLPDLGAVIPWLREQGVVQRDEPTGAGNGRRRP